MKLNGTYTDASIFAETIDSATLAQIRLIVNQKFMENTKVAIMPDAHAGAGVCIGFTASLGDYVVPNFIGVDIGCGIASQHFQGAVDFAELDKIIRKFIPNGQHNNDAFDISEIEKAVSETQGCPKDFVFLLGMVANKVYGNLNGKEKVFMQLGSLGGGNHFIAVNQTAMKENWLTVHSGSRNFGLTVANYHQKIAKETVETRPADYEAEIAKIIREGPENTIESRLKEYKESICKDRPPTGMEWLTGELAEAYYRDMQVAQWFAKVNRRIILNRIASHLNLETTSFPWSFQETIHNYIDFEDRVIRKGAVSAHRDEYLIIPLSMKDGILYCKGKGNREWNQSAPHGAGRLMSRTKAKADLTVEEYERQMREAGVWSSCIGEGTLDESPMAYKDPVEIKRAIGDTVEIIGHWSEVYNFKAKE